VLEVVFCVGLASCGERVGKLAASHGSFEAFVPRGPATKIASALPRGWGRHQSCWGVNFRDEVFSRSVANSAAGEMLSVAALVRVFPGLRSRVSRRQDVVIPEPSTLLVMGLGLIGFSRRQWRDSRAWGVGERAPA
jgi:hypothetical protein